MKKKFREEIDLKIYTHDSPEAQNYEFKGSTAVFVNNEFVPPDTALSSQEMEAFLKNSL
jgi:hypothetical protein